MNFVRHVWNRFWHSNNNAQQQDRHAVLLDLLWQTPIPTEEAVALIHNYPAAVKHNSNSDEAAYPLHLACGNGAEPAVITALVQAWPGGAAAVTARDLETPLHLACLRRLPLVTVVCLTEAHPRALRLSNKQNDLPLHLVCKQRPPNGMVVDYLVSQYPAAAGKRGRRGNLPLHLALQHGASNAVIQTLVGAMPPEGMATPNYDGHTPLHLAVGHADSLEVMRSLVQVAPATVFTVACKSQGDTPLHTACRRARTTGMDEVIRILVKANRETLKVQNKEQMTPLQLAEKCGAELEVIECLSEPKKPPINDPARAIVHGDPFDIEERFYRPHVFHFPYALDEIRQGQKESHWMWYLVPTPPFLIDGVEVGSPMNRRFALRSDQEVVAYLQFIRPDCSLRRNYVDLAHAILQQLQLGNPLRNVFPYGDHKKVVSSMQLFERVGTRLGDDELFLPCRRILELHEKHMTRRPNKRKQSPLFNQDHRAFSM